MRVLSVAFPAIPVGHATGGGAEQILSILERGLVDRGHQSVVVAAEGSRVAGELIETPGWRAAFEMARETGREVYWKAHKEAVRCALAKYSVDLIHFHGLDFHEYFPGCAIPMLATLHLPVSYYPSSILQGNRPSGLFVNCVSRNQADSAAISSSLPVILNGVPTNAYAPADAGTYLLWLGRVCPEKGVHIALQVAHSLDAPLTIAGPVHPYTAHQEYFSRCLKPLLDHRRTFAGPVDREQKRALLAHARCLLVPVWLLKPVR